MRNRSALFRSFSQPLASRLRPQTIDEIIGQDHLLGEGKVLRTMIEEDIIPSMIFWGPPGVGKTTLANVIARQTDSDFVNFSAVTSGIKEIREVMKKESRVEKKPCRSKQIVCDCQL